MTKPLPLLAHCLLLVMSFTLSTCNNVNDLQAPPQELVPELVISVLRDSLPGAENIVFKTVEENKLWEATYKRQSQQYYSAINRTKIIATYKLLGDTVKSVLRQATDLVSLRNAQLSEFKEKERGGNMNVSEEFSSKYLFDNQSYLLTWVPAVGNSGRSYVMNLDKFSKFGFITLDMSDLPAAVQTVYQARNLSHQGTKVYIGESNEKIFRSVGSVGSKSYEFIFDHAGRVIYSPYNITERYNALNLIPQFAQGYITAKKQFEGFSLLSGEKFEEAGQVGYKFSLLKSTPFAESYFLFFDNSGNLKYLTYNVVTNF